MDYHQEELSKIRKVLKDNPRGLTVSDIARRIHLNRNSASKYLEILVVSGQVEMMMQGPAKVYFLSRRVPVSAMLSFSSDIIAVLSHEMKVVYANDRFAEFVGRTRDESIGQKNEELCSTVFNHDLILPFLEEALNGKESSTEFMASGKAGIIHIRGRFIPAVFDEGQIGVTTIYEDISERKRWEEALQASEKKYRQLVELAHDGIMTVNADVTITFVNPRMAEMVGYTPDEMIGQPLWKVIGPESRRMVEDKIERRKKGLSDEYELPMKRKDGKTIYSHVRTAPLSSEKGGYDGSFIAVSDVTDQLTAIEALKASEKKYRQLVELAYEGIWAVDGNAKTTVVNPRMAEMLGYTPEEMVGRSLYEFIAEERKPVLDELLRRRKQGISERHDTELLKKDGRPIVVSVSSSPVLDQNGTFSGVIAFVMDITERKSIEETLKNASEDLQTMVAIQTKELEETMKDLHQEIAERIVIEEALRLDEARLEALLTLYDMKDQSTDDMVAFVTEKAIKLTGSRVGFMCMVNEDTKTMSHLYLSKDAIRLCSADEIEALLSLDDGLMAGPLQERKPVIANDSRNCPDGGHFTIKRLLGVPVIDEGKVIAEIIIANKKTDYNSTDVRQVTLLANGLWKTMQQKQAVDALSVNESNIRAMINAVQESSFLIESDGTIVAINDTMASRLRKPATSFVGTSIFDLLPPATSGNTRARMKEVLRTGKPATCEYERFGRVIGNTTYPVFSRDGKIVRLAIFGQDVTDRKRDEQEKEITVDFLKIVNACPDMRVLIKSAVLFFEQVSRCQAVCIHLCKECDVASHRNANTGNPVADCTCDDMICKHLDPSKSFRTAQGSFWTNSTTELLAGTSETNRQLCTGNKCNGEGYESVAMIPLMAGDKRIGVLQLRDKRRNLFTPASIALWERLAGYMAVSLDKMKAEETFEIFQERL